MRNELLQNPVGGIACDPRSMSIGELEHFEWVQNIQRFQWEEAEVLAKLEGVLHKAMDKVADFAGNQAVSTRMAAQAIAIQNVAESKAARGMFP